jgi:phage gp45-like
MSNTKVHKPQGGDQLVVESGGKILVKAGGAIEVDGDTYVVTEPDGVTIDLTNDDKLEVPLLADAGEGDVVALGTPVSNIAALTDDYTTGDMDSDAKIIAAFNATNAAVNELIAALEEFKIAADS